jgi:hypothetical protein
MAKVRELSQRSHNTRDTRKRKIDRLMGTTPGLTGGFPIERLRDYAGVCVDADETVRRIGVSAEEE